MGLGLRRKSQQQASWPPGDDLGYGPRNAFCELLTDALARTCFVPTRAEVAKPHFHYREAGRKSLALDAYIPMIFARYFEDISSQQQIACRCTDSRSLACCPGIAPGESTRDHRKRSMARQRLSMKMHRLTFGLGLTAAPEHGLIKGKPLCVNAPDLKGNASMQPIVRRDADDDWRLHAEVA